MYAENRYVCNNAKFGVKLMKSRPTLQNNTGKRTLGEKEEPGEADKRLQALKNAQDPDGPPHRINGLTSFFHRLF